MSENQNGWPEWSKYVLEELKRQGAAQEKSFSNLVDFRNEILELRSDIDTKLNEALGSIKAEISAIQTKIASIEPNKVITLSVDVENLKAENKDKEKRIRDIEIAQSTFLGKWTIIGAVSTIILAAIVSFLFNLAKPHAATLPEKPAITASSQQQQ